MKKIAPAIFSAFLAVFSVHAVETPGGWQTRRENGITFHMSDDAAGRIFAFGAVDPQPRGGPNSVNWLNQMAKQLASGYGQALKRGQAEGKASLPCSPLAYGQALKRGQAEGDDRLARANCRVEIKGKPVIIQFAAFPAGAGKMRLLQLLTEEDAEFARRHQNDVEK